MKKLLYIILLFPFLANAQVTGTIQLTTDSVRGNFGASGVKPMLTRAQSDARYLFKSGGLSFGAIGATPNANGGSYSAGVLTLQPASASFGGVVTTGTQTFAGSKTFSSTILHPGGTGLQIGSGANTAGSQTIIVGTGGQTTFLQEGGTPGASMTGTTAYMGVAGTYTATAFGIAQNNVVRTVWNAAAMDHTGTFSASTSVTSPIFATPTTLNLNSGELTAIFRSSNATSMYTQYKVNSGAPVRGSIGTADELLTGGAATDFAVVSAGSVLKFGTGTTLAQTITGANTTLAGTLGIGGVADNVKGGTYTPTVTNVSGLTGGTSFVSKYIRVGNTVTVYGRYNSTTTSPSGTASFRVTLPVASAFSSAEQCYGVGQSESDVIKNIYVRSDATNDEAIITVTSTSASLFSMYYSFSYEVL
jgi:hypothetical protein